MSEPIDPFHQLLIEFEEQGRWEDLLGNVLAVLNGDGGHYQVEHGAGRAAIRGIRRHYRLYEHADALAEALAGVQCVRRDRSARAAALRERGATREAGTMNIIKSITKTIVRAPADIMAGALEAITEGLDAVGDALDKPEGKKRK